MLQNTLPEPSKYAVSTVMNQQLEATMLGHLIEDKFAALKVLHLLSEDCFTLPAHHSLFHAIVALDLAGLQVTETSVIEQLRQTVSEERANYIVAEAAHVFGMHNDLEPEYMAIHLIEYAKRRKLTEVAKKVNRLLSDMTYDLNTGAAEVLELFEETLMGHRESVVTLSEVLNEVGQIADDNQHPERRHTGVLCGLPDIDREGGLPADGLVIIGAKTSHGKTTFAINVAVHALLQGHRVACFSIEMTRQRVASRIVSMRSGVNSNAIMRQCLPADQLQRTHQAITELQQSVAGNFYFDNRNTHDVNGLVMMIRSLCKMQKVDVFVIDYAQLVDASPGQPCETDNKLLALLSHKLHDVAREFRICILLLSQVNRNAPGMPTISNLRGSGEMEEAADMIILLYNAYHANATFEAPFQTFDTKDRLQVTVAKNRDGALCSFLLAFNPSLTFIAPLDPQQLTLTPKVKTTPEQKVLDFFNENSY